MNKLNISQEIIDQVQYLTTTREEIRKDLVSLKETASDATLQVLRSALYDKDGEINKLNAQEERKLLHVVGKVSDRQIRAALDAILYIWQNESAYYNLVGMELTDTPTDPLKPTLIRNEHGKGATLYMSQKAKDENSGMVLFAKSFMIQIGQMGAYGRNYMADDKKKFKVFHRNIHPFRILEQASDKVLYACEQCKATMTEEEVVVETRKGDNDKEYNTWVCPCCKERKSSLAGYIRQNPINR